MCLTGQQSCCQEIFILTFFFFFWLIPIYVRELKTLVPEVSSKSIFSMHDPGMFFPFILTSLLFLSFCELMQLMLVSSCCRPDGFQGLKPRIFSQAWSSYSYWYNARIWLTTARVGFQSRSVMRQNKCHSETWGNCNNLSEAAQDNFYHFNIQINFPTSNVFTGGRKRNL